MIQIMLIKRLNVNIRPRQNYAEKYENVLKWQDG